MKINLFESKNLNTLVESLVNDYDLQLNEAIEMSKTIEDLLKQYGYDIPDKAGDIVAIKSTNDPGYLKVVRDKNGRLVSADIKKIGALLGELFPGIDLVGDQRVQELIGKLKLISDKKQERYEFIVDDIVSKWYIKLYQESKIGSCVVGEGGFKIKSGLTNDLLKAMDKCPNIKIVVIRDTKPGYQELIGRALLWVGVTDETDGEVKTFLDRTYPSGNNAIHELFLKWADEQGYLHMDGMSHDGIISDKNRNLTFNMKMTAKEAGIMPWMDSFFWAKANQTGEIVLYNYNPGGNNAIYLHSQDGEPLVKLYSCEYCGNRILTEEDTKFSPNGSLRFHKKCYDIVYRPCSVCKETFHQNSLRHYEDVDYCETCFMEKFKMCGECEKWFDKKTTKFKRIHTMDKKTQIAVCPTCYDKSSTCTECDIRYMNKNIEEFEGKKYCKKCIIKYELHRCSDCKKLVKFDKFVGHINSSDGQTYVDEWCVDCFNVVAKNYIKSNANSSNDRWKKIIMQYRLLSDMDTPLYKFDGEQYYDSTGTLKTMRVNESLLYKILPEKYSYLMLKESIDIPSQITRILTKYGYDIPEDSPVKKITITDKPGTLDYDEIDKQGRNKTTSTTRIGALLKKIFPDIDLVGNQQVQAMINEIKLLSTKTKLDFEVEVSDDITHWYVTLDKEYGIDSCVTDSCRPSVLLKGMDAQDDIKIAIMKDKFGDPCGRALLWMNIEGLDAPLLDRTYPYSDSIHSKYIQWAESMGYYYRDATRYGPSTISGEKRLLKYNFHKPASEVKVMPFMDTFYYGREVKGELKIYNYKVVDKDWQIQNADGTYLTGNYSDYHSDDDYDSYNNDSYYDCWFCDSEINTDHDEYHLLDEDFYDESMYVCTDCFRDRCKECEACERDYLSEDVQNVYKDSDKKDFEDICIDCIGQKNYIQKCTSCFDYFNITFVKLLDGVCPNCKNEKEINNDPLKENVEVLDEYFKSINGLI